MTAPEPSTDVTLRPLESQADYDACVELQRETWGRDFAEVVPASLLKISQHVGAVAAGAFSPDGGLLGFVFGLTGLRSGPPRILHWSHMMAVKPEARDLHLGTRLKLYQRELLLPLGVEVVEWTFDPLEARNAHLNLNRLGADVEDYVEEMYASEEGSELWSGIGSDRFIVGWRIAGEPVREILAGKPRSDAGRFRDVPPANPGGDVADPLPEAPRVTIEIPENIQELKSRDLERAYGWRLSTRRAFQTYLGRGYRVEAFWRDPADNRCFYGLAAREG